jgi:hypothetical protein
MRWQPDQFGIALVAWLTICSSTAHPQTADVRWDTEPYRIRAWLAVDAPGELAERLATELPAYLDDRVVAAIGPAWRYETVPADVKLGCKMRRDINAVALADLSASGDDFDKELLLLIETTPWGYRLTAREYDRYTDRWGRTLVATTRQSAALPEELFALVRRAVAPLAKVEVDPRNPKTVTLRMRAAAIPQKSGDFQWAAPGDVLVPMTRRSTRDGALVEGGIQQVPWTYLEVLPLATAADGSENSASDAPPKYMARVHSGMPTPLSRRRRARTELVAIAVRPDDGESITVKLRSRTDEAKPLVGYEVETEDLGDEKAHLIGRSDERGELRVSSRQSSIQTLTVKSGGSVLARVPVVAGLGGEIEMRLPDDDLRLQAAARLASLREDLIDVVARRNIYMARVRRQIEDHNFDRARDLMKELEDLPGATQFRQTLDREARLHKSKDPQVQRRIDQLFIATEVALGQFLDPRPIGELREELQQAQASGSETAQR